MRHLTPDLASTHADYQPRLSPSTQTEVDAHFGYDQPTPLTDAELDRLYVEEMERRQQPPVKFQPFTS